MNPTAGVLLIVAGSAIHVALVVVFHRRWPAAALIGLLMLAGAAIGAGALLVQREVGPGDWVITLAVLAVLGPVHARALRGPIGRPPTR